ncbi:TlpA family protein disulfide reductase [Pontibacter populi]|uniref:TlpA disulfide reductase family protein n=1 Tax=Pontibacter populi TaxID=890055 RepID=A0ABV1RW58_9BACT
MTKNLLTAICSALMILISGQVFAQTSAKAGEIAPEIHITDWIENVPDDKDLRGKYIVLEFWATWCGPCIAAVPHMNELQKEFNSSDLYYLSISDEPVEKIKRTLKRVDFKSIVVTDQTGQTHKNYGDKVEGLQAIPLTVLIDNKGFVKWVGLPTQLTRKVMADFLEDKNDATRTSTVERKKLNSTESPKKEFSDIMTLLQDKNTPYYFNLQESEVAKKSKMAVGMKAIDMKGYTLEEIFEQVLSINKQNLKVPDALKDKRFNLMYKNSNDDALNKIELEQKLLIELGLTKKIEVIQVKGYEVSVKDSSLLEKTMAEKGFTAKSDADNKTLFTSYTIKNTLDEISKDIAVPFRFSGDDKTQYDFIINNTSAAEIVSSLKSYGLEATAKSFRTEQVELKSAK